MRLLLLAAAPGPEVKYLRRWASDAGLAVHAEIATGGGVELGDAPLPLTAATLAASDVAILDLRRWTALPPPARATVVAAVRNGLGLVVRIDGPVTEAARVALRPLGLAVTGGDDTAPLALPAPAGDDAVRLARRGPGTPDDPATADRGDALPVLARWNVNVAAPAATPLLRDARGAAVAVWHAEGAGRVVLWPVADSYRLVLAGAGDTYDALWRTVVTAVGRGRGPAAPTIAGPARVGARVVLCGLDPDAGVIAPDGRTTPLFADSPVGGCAGFWPRDAGWHRLHQSGGDRPFFVAAASALPNVRLADDAAATRALAAAAPASSARPAATQPGSPWPWSLAWLVASAALWWFERARQRRGDGE